MTPKRLFFVLIASIFALFVLIIVGAYEINSLLTSRAGQLTQLKAKDQALDQEQLSLANAKKEVATYSDLQKITQSIVPEDKDQAEAVREIVKIAADHGIVLGSITFPASSLGATSVGGAVGAGTGATNSSSTATLSPQAGKLSQLQPVKNIPGVYVLQITVQNDTDHPVTYASFIGFLRDLEHNRRTAQISSINIQPTIQNPNLLSFTLVLNEYIKP